MTTDPTDFTKKDKTYQLSSPKSGFFYHCGVWLDMNGDGRLDILTARSNAQAG